MRVRLLVAALLSSVLVAVGALPADPASALAFRAPARVTATGCSQSLIAFDSAGRGHGWAPCFTGAGKDHLAYVEGSGSHWTTKVTAYLGTPLAVADDGTTTYLLYQVGFMLTLAKRTHAGRITVQPLHNALRVMNPDNVSLVASRGKWWAIWDEPVASCGCQQLWQARTMVSTQSAHNLRISGQDPAIALRGTSVVAAWDALFPVSGLFVGYPTATGFTRTRIGDGANPTISYASGTVRVAWVFFKGNAASVVYRQSTSRGWSGWTSHHFVAAYGAKTLTDDLRRPMIAVSGGITTVAWTTPTSATLSAVVAQNRGGRWAETVVHDGLPVVHGTEVMSLGSVAGRAQLVLVHLASLETSSWDVFLTQ